MPNELGYALKTYPPSLNNTYCTLTPQAMAICEKRGISHTALEDYDIYSETEKMKDMVHDEVLKTIDIGDAVLKSYYGSNNILDNYISPFRSSIHRLSVLIGGSRLRLYYLTRMFTSTEAKKVVWFGKPAKVLSYYDNNNAFTVDGSIEIALLKYTNWSNLEMEDLSVNFKSQMQPLVDKIKYKEGLKKLIKKNIKDMFPNKIISWLKIMKICRASFIKLIIPLSKNILIESTNPLILRLIPSLIKKGIRIKLAKDFYPFMNKWEGLDNTELERDLYKTFYEHKTFRWNNADWTNFVFPLISYLGSLCKPLAFIAKQTQSYIQNKNIGCVLTIGAHRAHIYALLIGAKRAGAKIITWQHGAYGAYGDKYMVYDDIDISDYHICPGLGDAQLHVKSNYLYAGKCKPLGYVNSDYSIRKVKTKRPFKTENDKKKQYTIVYATTLYFQNSGIFLQYENIIWKDSEIYKNQKMIIKGLKKLSSEIPNLKIIIKLHPADFQNNIPDVDIINLPDSFTVIHKTPSFTELLESGDIVVIDEPSTSLVQSVVTKKPLFILNARNRLIQKAEDRLMKRAVVKGDPKSLIDTLKDYIINDVYRADVEDNTFSYYYSDPYGDGNLYKRAADLINQTYELK